MTFFPLYTLYLSSTISNRNLDISFSMLPMHRKGLKVFLLKSYIF